MFFWAAKNGAEQKIPHFPPRPVKNFSCGYVEKTGTLFFYAGFLYIVKTYFLVLYGNFTGKSRKYTVKIGNKGAKILAF